MKLFILLFIALSPLIEESSQQQEEEENLRQLHNTCDTPFLESFVRHANNYRRLHSAQPLEGVIDEPNSELTYYAQLKATFMAGNSPYDPPNPVGIPFLGIHTHFEPEDSAKRVVREMYRQGRHYPYYCREPPSWAVKDYADFTQLLWRATTKITFGCDDDYRGSDDHPGPTRHMVMIFWEEPGNQLGQYTCNVLPHNRHCPDCDINGFILPGEIAANNVTTEEK